MVFFYQLDAQIVCIKIKNLCIKLVKKTIIRLKHPCIKQAHGGGMEAYPNVSGYSLFVLCGSQHVHSYQFPCFRRSLYLYWRCLSFS